MDRRLCTGVFVDHGQHGGDGGFAVAARNGDHLRIALANLPQRHAALQFGNPFFTRHNPLRIIRLNRGGVDHKIGAIDIFPCVSDGITDALVIQRIRKLRALAVGTGDLMSLRF
ncbi:hypothetical protein SDC9_155198 [bioreactor metagenome]|uniref:Uncharacterized protein n=1 Tax=bioreactor metagenome TaxID=1076179 RepID=A0A645F2S5_9ZZZZ